MLIVGGEINTGICGIPELFDRRDEEELIALASRQLELGAQMLGINLCGRKDEREEVAWAVRTIQSRFKVPIAFDTPDLELFRESIRLHDNSGGLPLLNSSTTEPERLMPALELAAEHGLPLVVLPLDGNGRADSPDQLLFMTGYILRNAEKYGVPISNIRLDPMLRPLSISDRSGRLFLEALRSLRENFPGIRTICGLDNISHGLPGRELVSSTFLAMAMAFGLDGVILKTNRMHYAVLKAALALLGDDPYCGGYIEAWRTGVWDEIIEDEEPAGGRRGTMEG